MLKSKSTELSLFTHRSMVLCMRPPLPARFITILILPKTFFIQFFFFSILWQDELCQYLSSHESSRVVQSWFVLPELYEFIVLVIVSHSEGRGDCQRSHCSEKENIWGGQSRGECRTTWSPMQIIMIHNPFYDGKYPALEIITLRVTSQCHCMFIGWSLVQAPSNYLSLWRKDHTGQEISWKG